MSFKIRTLCWMVCAVTFAAQHVAALDRIYIRGKAPIEGTITAMHREYVTLEKSGSPQKFAANEILKIAYDDDPEQLRSARDNAIQGQVENALKDLQGIPASALKRDEIRQEVDFYKAFCAAKIALASGANLKAADDALGAFFAANKGNFHLFEAVELSGQVAVAQGDWENAAKRFAILSKAPWPDFQLRASVFEARAYTSQKDYAKAQEKYEQVMKSDDNAPEAQRQKLLARIGKVVCMAETGKADEAIALVEDVIKNQDSKDTIVFARAYNALGRCHMKQKKFKEALLDYLHVDLLFFNDSEAHAESLYFLAQLWSNAQKSDRAVAARTLLQQRYAGSVWNKQQ